MAKINNSSPAWWGFTSADDRGRLEAFYRRCARLSHACFVTNPKNLPAVFFIPHERAIIVVKCDFSNSYAAADKI